MITRIGKHSDFVDGGIYELAENSEPLYIWNNGRLREITPVEYNICTITEISLRWGKIVEHRNKIKYWPGQENSYF